MQSDYTQEIERLIANTFTPSTSQEKSALPKTLEEFHTMVINVLPAKWIYETDVYESLKKLGFKVSYGEKDAVAGLFYFVTVN